LGGFLEPIGHFERIGTVISITKGFEHDERNPPLQKPHGPGMPWPYVINHTPENTTIAFAGQGKTRKDALGGYRMVVIATE
jgi:hypothetical protein